MNRRRFLLDTAAVSALAIVPAVAGPRVSCHLVRWGGVEFHRTDGLEGDGVHDDAPALQAAFDAAAADRPWRSTRPLALAGTVRVPSGVTVIFDHPCILRGSGGIVGWA